MPQSVVDEQGPEGEQKATSVQDITTNDKTTDSGGTREIGVDPQNEDGFIRIRNIESLMENSQEEDCIVLE